MITLIISERNELMRLGLKAACEASTCIEVVGDYATADDMLPELNGLKPDVVVLGTQGSIIERRRICAEMRKLSPKTRILALTEDSGDDDLHDIILSGVSGSVAKDASGAEILKSVRVVARGGLHFENDALLRLFGRIPGRQRDDRSHALDKLTERERAILSLVAQGRSDVEIGRKLNLSRFTVRNRIVEMRNKLAMETRQHLVAYAIRHGALDE